MGSLKILVGLCWGLARLGWVDLWMSARGVTYYTDLTYSTISTNDRVEGVRGAYCVHDGLCIIGLKRELVCVEACGGFATARKFSERWMMKVV